jgi:hypothetical protein
LIGLRLIFIECVVVIFELKSCLRIWVSSLRRIDGIRNTLADSRFTCLGQSAA